MTAAITTVLARRLLAQLTHQGYGCRRCSERERGITINTVSMKLEKRLTSTSTPGRARTTLKT